MNNEQIGGLVEQYYQYSFDTVLDDLGYQIVIVIVRGMIMAESPRRAILFSSSSSRVEMKRVKMETRQKEELKL
jgi:hypothetical protein